MINVETLFANAAAGELPALAAVLDSEPACAAATNSQGIGLLMWAMYHRQRDIAKLVYDYLENPSAEDAVAAGDQETLRAAITADPSLISQYSSDGFTLLHYACFFARADCVKLLLAHKAEINCAAQNPSKVYPLHSAAAAQAGDIVSLLLEAGADPNVRQAGGFTALMSAAAHNNIGLVNLLLSYGADKKVEDDAGLTAYRHGTDKGFAIPVLTI